jgi:hypothetical protein
LAERSLESILGKEFLSARKLNSFGALLQAVLEKLLGKLKNNTFLKVKMILIIV